MYNYLIYSLSCWGGSLNYYMYWFKALIHAYCYKGLGQKYVFMSVNIYIWGCINWTFSVIDIIFFAMMVKSEGHPSLLYLLGVWRYTVCTHIEPFGTRLSVRYALQTNWFVQLILTYLENKRTSNVWNRVMFSVPLRSTRQPKRCTRQRAVWSVITSPGWGASKDDDDLRWWDTVKNIICNIKRIWHFQLK